MEFVARLKQILIIVCRERPVVVLTEPLTYSKGFQYSRQARPW